MSLPNLLTLSRIILIPVFVIAYYFPNQNAHLIAASLFAVAGFTDWLDGYLARKMNQTTPFGAFLDPVADKLMVAAALVVIVQEYHVLHITLPAIVIIGREIVISALREWMAEMGKRASVAVSYIGKVKTAAQMWAIMLLLAGNAWDWVSLSGEVLLYGAAVLTLWSMIIYLRAAWPEFKLSAN
ncbi:MAG: CDP-diacylglycerol--glycerol-3-phosphate 3-phosphatidyltransferase [Hahellaceae bacterium]|nr:CDP-diacylglycerol--glycerol-3-phosphate 3-phosphatidyltransferase [Hahellaceae bacterium]